MDKEFPKKGKPTDNAVKRALKKASSKGKKNKKKKSNKTGDSPSVMESSDSIDVDLSSMSSTIPTSKTPSLRDSSRTGSRKKSKKRSKSRGRSRSSKKSKKSKRSGASKSATTETSLAATKEKPSKVGSGAASTYEGPSSLVKLSGATTIPNKASDTTAPDTDTTYVSNPTESEYSSIAPYENDKLFVKMAKKPSKNPVSSLIPPDDDSAQNPFYAAGEIPETNGSEGNITGHYSVKPSVLAQAKPTAKSTAKSKDLKGSSPGKKSATSEKIGKTLDGELSKKTKKTKKSSKSPNILDASASIGNTSSDIDILDKSVSIKRSKKSKKSAKSKHAEKSTANSDALKGSSPGEKSPTSTNIGLTLDGELSGDKISSNADILDKSMDRKKSKKSSTNPNILDASVSDGKTSSYTDIWEQSFGNKNSKQSSTNPNILDASISDGKTSNDAKISEEKISSLPKLPSEEKETSAVAGSSLNQSLAGGNNSTSSNSVVNSVGSSLGKYSTASQESNSVARSFTSSQLRDYSSTAKGSDSVRKLSKISEKPDTDYVDADQDLPEYETTKLALPESLADDAKTITVPVQDAGPLSLSGERVSSAAPEAQPKRTKPEKILSKTAKSPAIKRWPTATNSMKPGSVSSGEIGRTYSTESKLKDYPKSPAAEEGDPLMQNLEAQREPHLAEPAVNISASSDDEESTSEDANSDSPTPDETSVASSGGYRPSATMPSDHLDYPRDQHPSSDQSSPTSSLESLRTRKKKARNMGIIESIRVRWGHMQDSIRVSKTLDKFENDAVLILVHKPTMRAMRVTDFDEIDCKGDPGCKQDEQLHFRVINYGWNIISLKSLTFPLIDDKYLCVRKDGFLYSDGSVQSNQTRFRLHETDDHCVTLESYEEMKHHIGFNKKGELIPPHKMPKKEDCTHFFAIIVRTGEESQESTAWDVMR